MLLPAIAPARHAYAIDLVGQVLLEALAAGRVVAIDKAATF